MKTLGRIPHPEMNITLFMWNNKYIIKFEAGPYEQVYKLDASYFEESEKVKSLVTESFTASVAERFRQMNAEFSEVMKTQG